jgi:glutathione S-transferase
MLINWVFGDRASEINFEKDYPDYYAWDQRLMARPSVKKIVQDRQAAMSGH